MALLSKVVQSLLMDKLVFQLVDAPREEKTFELSRCIRVPASTYPDHYSGVQLEWKESVSNFNGDAISLITPNGRYHNSSCTKSCNEEFKANTSKLGMRELRLSLQELMLEDCPDTDALMDDQESDSIGAPFQHPPGSGSAKGGSTQGAKIRRKFKSDKDKTPGGLEKVFQIPGGIKL